MFVLTEKEEGVFHLHAEGVIEKYNIVIDDHIVGTIDIVNNGDECLYVDHLYIYEEHRKKNYGTQAVHGLFTKFPQEVKRLIGMATDGVLEGFWEKQKGYRYAGEGHDETEGFFYFDILK